MKIIDKRVTLATIDRFFIATNVELVHSENNPDRELCRYEFLEILVRLAGAKFKDIGVCNTYRESMDILLNEHIIPFMKVEPWQEFRDADLWTLEVNDILDSNLENLKRIYKKHFQPKKHYMSVTDAVNLVMRHAPLGIAEKEALFCIGMSKMTVVEELTMVENYKKVHFVEFLEFLGRVAHAKYAQDEQMKDAPLWQKIRGVLQILLPTILGVEPNEVPYYEVEEKEEEEEVIA